MSTLEDGTVRLQKANGRYVRVAFGRLSVVDQQFLRDNVKTIAMNW